MSGRSAGEKVVSHRKQTTPEDEPILEFTRSLTATGQGSVNVNLASEACDIIGFPRYEQVRQSDDTEVKVQIFADRYVVRPKYE